MAYEMVQDFPISNYILQYDLHNMHVSNHDTLCL